MIHGLQCRIRLGLGDEMGRPGSWSSSAKSQQSGGLHDIPLAKVVMWLAAVSESLRLANCPTQGQVHIKAERKAWRTPPVIV
jgi:hypothetical protein